MANKISFKGFKNKSLSDQRRIRRNYQRQYRAKQKKEFLKPKNDWTKVRTRLMKRANALDRVQSNQGDKLRQAVKNYEKNLLFNNDKVISEKRKEYGQRKRTKNAYAALGIWGKDLLRNKPEYNVKVIKNRVTSTAAFLTKGVPTSMSKNGILRADLTGLSKEKINEYKRHRRSLTRGKETSFYDTLNAYKKFSTGNEDVASDEIVSAVDDVVNSNEYNPSDISGNMNLIDKKIDSYNI